MSTIIPLPSPSQSPFSLSEFPPLCSPSPQYPDLPLLSCPLLSWGYSTKSPSAPTLSPLDSPKLSCDPAQHPMRHRLHWVLLLAMVKNRGKEEMMLESKQSLEEQFRECAMGDAETWTFYTVWCESLRSAPVDAEGDLAYYQEFASVFATMVQDRFRECVAVWVKDGLVLKKLITIGAYTRPAVDPNPAQIGGKVTARNLAVAYFNSALPTMDPEDPRACHSFDLLAKTLSAVTSQNTIEGFRDALPWQMALDREKTLWNALSRGLQRVAPFA